MGIVITMANQKGGVAKTTTALALARIFSEKGYRVLCLNLDPQRNMDQGLGAEVRRKDLETPTLYHVLTGQLTLPDVIRHGSFCDLAPASNLMYGWSMPEGVTKKDYEELKNDPEKLLQLVHEKFSEEYQVKLSYQYTHIIEQEVRKVIDNYDFILIDTNPSLSLLTMNGLNAASMGYVLVPAYTEETSREAILELQDTLTALNASQPQDIKIIGILLTKVLKNTRISRRFEKYYKAMAKKMGTILFETKIRRAISVSEYIESKTDLLEYDPDGTASQDYRAFGEEFLKRLSQLEGKQYG